MSTAPGAARPARALGPRREAPLAPAAPAWAPGSLAVVAEGSRAHRAWQGFGHGLLLAALVAAPFRLDSVRVGHLSRGVAYAVALLGLNLLIGRLGLISLGHNFFVGLGAYTAAVLMTDHGWGWFAVVPAAVAVAGLAGVALGVPALRVRGLSLVLVTLAVGIAFPILSRRIDSASGRPIKTHLDPPFWTGLDPASAWGQRTYHYYLILAGAAAAYVVVRRITTGPFGRLLTATKEQRVAASAYGVNTRLVSLAAFGASAAVAGLAGVLLVYDTPFVIGDQYPFTRSIELYTLVMVFGLGRLLGALPGGLVLVFTPILLSEHGQRGYEGLIFAVALLALTYLAPGGGLSGLFVGLLGRIVAVVPTPPGPPGEAEARERGVELAVDAWDPMGPELVVAPLDPGDANGADR